MARAYILTFEVEPIRPSASFPIDMLRYDSCYPAREQDSNAIDRHYNHTSKESVRLKRGPYKLKNDATRLNKSRWESFGWRIISVFDKSYSSEVGVRQVDF